MTDSKPKTVQIEPVLYDRIREFCQLNSLTITSYINSVLKKNLMVDMYGDSPFSDRKKGVEIIPQKEEEISVAVETTTAEPIQEKPKISKKPPIKKEEKETEVTTTLKPIVTNISRKRRLS